ncbi:hypothetical protein K1719_007467 [Acacia pycnantha]|nr:hypothetical protein K1719_007467 [Acacia pycnantha]
MVDKPEEKVASYRSKLLNLDGGGTDLQSQKEVIDLNESDFQISKEGDIPAIAFSETVRVALSKGMERTLIIKALGRLITYYELKARIQALWQPKGSFGLVDMEGASTLPLLTRKKTISKP